MKKYSNTERLKALNRVFRLISIISEQKTNTVFTPMTQHFTAKTIEEAADYIIHFEKFLKIYNYKHYIDFHFDNSGLAIKRFEVWFKENRKLNANEENKQKEKDKKYNLLIEKLNKKNENVNTSDEILKKHLGI